MAIHRRPFPVPVSFLTFFIWQAIVSAGPFLALLLFCLKPYLMSEQQLKEAFDLHYTSLVHFASTYVDQATARDIVQNVFIKMWRQEPASIKAYLFQAVRNGCIDYINAEKKLRKEAKLLAAVTDEALELEVIKIDALVLINQAMEVLKPDQHEVVTLHFREGLSLQQVAERLNKPYKTIATLKDRALIRMRKFFRCRPALTEMLYA